MSREGLEVADVFRHFGPAFRDQHGTSLSATRRRAMLAIESCRTAALGGHIERCDDCGHQRIAYDSCLMGKFSNGESAGDRTSDVGQMECFSRISWLVCPHKFDVLALC
jgi:Transposase zinc-binding domain